MLEAIPIDYYSDIYFHLLLAINFFTLFHCYVLDIDNVKNIIYIKVMGILIFAFTAVYLGFRPIHRIFVDMGAYAQYFSHYMHGGDLLKKKDMTFQYFMKFLSNFMGYKGFFFTCLIIYVLPMFIISKRLFKKYWFYSFLMLISSFSFWAYGVNGIRNGIATSLFLLALAYRNNKALLVLLLFLSCSFHKTMSSLSFSIGSPFAFLTVTVRVCFSVSETTKTCTPNVGETSVMLDSRRGLPPALKVLGSDSKTHLESRCSQAKERVDGRTPSTRQPVNPWNVIHAAQMTISPPAVTTGVVVETS